MGKTTEARRRANDKYDGKTYKKINIALRKEDDGDIIQAIEEAKAKGINNREWLRSLFDKANN